MITIGKKVKISKTNHKVEFDLDDLPEGEYEVQLLVTEGEDKELDKRYDLANWRSGIILDPLPLFRREDMYDDDGR
jgi:hypothetical protein